MQTRWLGAIGIVVPTLCWALTVWMFTDLPSRVVQKIAPFALGGFALSLLVGMWLGTKAARSGARWIGWAALLYCALGLACVVWHAVRYYVMGGSSPGLHG